MSNQHTPEPWSYEVSDEYDENSCDVFDGNDLSIIDGSNGLITQANARRIVACVNACAGVDVAWIESMAKTGGFAAMNQYIAAYNQAAAAINAEKQRDDLLAVLEKLTHNTFETYDDVAELAFSAIASAKGGAA